MYEVKDWNEEAFKWLAVAMCVGLVAMAVVPFSGSITNIAGVITGAYAGYHADSPTGAVVDGAYYGLMASTVPLAAYGVMLAAGVATGGVAIAAGIAIAA